MSKQLVYLISVLSNYLVIIRNTMIVTRKDLKEAKTNNGGFTKDQVEFIIGLTGSRKWGKNIVGLDIPQSSWDRFKKLGEKSKAIKKPVFLNSTTTQKDSFWKPEKNDIPKPKFKSSKNKKKPKKLNKRKRNDFYSCREWRELRYRALRWHGFACMCCGKTKDQGAQLHVDHIKPISKHPELKLSFNNLQVLCKDCNLGKSNKYDDDFRNQKDITSQDESKAMLSDLRTMAVILDKESLNKAYLIFKKAMDDKCTEESEELDSLHLSSMRGIHF